MRIVIDLDVIDRFRSAAANLNERGRARQARLTCTDLRILDSGESEILNATRTHAHGRRRGRPAGWVCGNISVVYREDNTHHDAVIAVIPPQKPKKKEYSVVHSTQCNIYHFTKMRKMRCESCDVLC